VQGLVVGLCGHDNGPSGSVRGRKFLNKLSDYYLLKEASAAWSS
jgi:hypothetical protein